MINDRTSARWLINRYTEPTHRAADIGVQTMRITY